MAVEAPIRPDINQVSQPKIKERPKPDVLRIRGVIKGIQMGIGKKQGFQFNGLFHESLYLKPVEIIESLQEFLKYQPEPTRTTRKAERIIAKRWIPLCSGDLISEIRRRSAAKTLLTLSQSRRAEIVADYREGKIGEEEFGRYFEPIEGVRLSLLAEISPRRHASIIKPDRKEIEIVNKKEVKI